ncbi:rho GTPase-activating protein 100F-like isoform X2 [Limulus polyphemus]|uniref:Rho GTPase-activating protein 100F-like isoform X2 n=1 Tax=Limulus polyphemus TaxID=6850 RepID=A0ABM1TMP5_LIMPO|nr:rho GTPase-activating protein 100F-like isoform X2 [Limulus polyphemus]
MKSPAPRGRYKAKLMHFVLPTNMLCCGRKKEMKEVVGPSVVEEVIGRPGPSRPRIPEMVVQRDFRKVSGISTEVFRQIEAVENDYDATTAANMEVVERRGEMIIRVLDPRSLGRIGAETSKKYLSAATSSHTVQFIEIIKRPGQTLGLYIREGDGIRRTRGVYISRIALESAVYNSGLLKVGDEILAVNLVDVKHMSLDDVVIIMSIPRRLVLTIRSKIFVRIPSHPPRRLAEEVRPPIVVWKKEMEEEEATEDFNSNSENGQLIHARTKGLPSGVPSVAIPLDDWERREYDDHGLYYNSRPRLRRVPMAEIREEERRWRRAPERARRPVVMRQPRAHQKYPKMLESLAEQVHPFHRCPPPPAPSKISHLSHRTLDTRPVRSSAARRRYWDEYEASLSSRPKRIMRAESEQRIPRDRHHEEDVYNRYAARDHRLSLRTTRTMQPKVRTCRSLREGPPQAGILRRSVIESCSDTEVHVNSKEPAVLYRQGSLGRMPPSREHYHFRSNSLPRARATDLETRRRRQSVRFEKKTLPYDSQEDSDGAVSAPEFPSSRSGRKASGRRRRSPDIFTAGEYRDWLRRAPSTSAIYERLRRGRGLRQVQPLPRVAHSVESLLDSLNHRQRGLYAPYVPVRRSLLRPRAEEFAQTSHLIHPHSLEHHQTVPFPSPTKHSDEKLHLLTLDPKEFYKYRPQRDSERKNSGTDSFSGLLRVHLLTGRGLRPTEQFDHFRDLYCVIESDNVHKARTAVRTGEHSFDWDEVFELDLFENQELSFLIYSWDPRYRHKLCYKGTINLSLLKEEPIHSLALKLGPCGTLYLKLQFTELGDLLQRIPARTSTGVFGVDLETIVARENSNIGVPLILKLCMDEVESRGLTFPGVYRICGSALSKKMLRDGFERNSWLVDLTEENVPDINVVASLLKDYLRELPEPLFTKGLFDMLIDGISVCLPDDSEGNTKLMFSILDCLPKVNRCTILCLMDHLKQVASYSERNKMTSQNLAVCFGPVVMCHTMPRERSDDLQKPIDVLRYLLDTWPVHRGEGSSDSSTSGKNSQTPVEDNGGNDNGRTTSQKTVEWSVGH